MLVEDQRDCSISVLENFQNLAGRNPGQPPLNDPVGTGGWNR